MLLLFFLDISNNYSNCFLQNPVILRLIHGDSSYLTLFRGLVPWKNFFSLMVSFIAYHCSQNVRPNAFCHWDGPLLADLKFLFYFTVTMTPKKRLVAGPE